jgi:hypothetical protein
VFLPGFATCIDSFFSTNQDTSSLHQIKPSPCISCRLYPHLLGKSRMGREIAHDGWPLTVTSRRAAQRQSPLERSSWSRWDTMWLSFKVGLTNAATPFLLVQLGPIPFYLLVYYRVSFHLYTNLHYTKQHNHYNNLLTGILGTVQVKIREFKQACMIRISVDNWWFKSRVLYVPKQHGKRTSNQEAFTMLYSQEDPTRSDWQKDWNKGHKHQIRTTKLSHIISTSIQP